MSDLNPKNLLFNSIFYTVGLIASIAATKFSDDMFPDNDPVVIRKVVDTMKVVHEYLNNNPTIVASSHTAAEPAPIMTSEKQSWHYNELEDIHKVMPKMRGHVDSDESSHFIFHCPKIKSKEDYIDLTVEFYDNSLVEHASCIYVVVSSITSAKSVLTGTSPKPKPTIKYEHAYKIRKGMNKIKLRNYFVHTNTKLEIGYLTKSDADKKYPVFEKVTCNY